MAIGESNNIISDLIEQIKGLFGGNQTTTIQNKPIANNKPISNKVYQSPIRGEWYNSGGFDLTSRRPNGRVGHQGVDMRCQGGTPIYSLAPGIVTSIGTDPVGGNVINISHPNGVRSYYAHLSTIKVHKGDKVGLDTIIATSGNSGNAKGTFPHLHFQVWKDGQITDPAKFFSIPKYTDLSDKEKKRDRWISPQAKQDAKAFNIKSHTQNKRMAFSKDVDQLFKLSYQYSKITKKI